MPEQNAQVRVKVQADGDGVRVQVVAVKGYLGRTATGVLDVPSSDPLVEELAGIVARIAETYTDRARHAAEVSAARSLVAAVDYMGEA